MFSDPNVPLRGRIESVRDVLVSLQEQAEEYSATAFEDKDKYQYDLWTEHKVTLCLAVSFIDIALEPK